MGRYSNAGMLTAMVLLFIYTLVLACGTLEVGIERTPMRQASPTPGPTETVPAPSPAAQ